MEKIKILVFLFFANASISAQINDSTVSKYNLSIEQNYFYRIHDNFSGSEFLFNLSFNKNKKSQFGISTGIFFHTKISEKSSTISRIDYTHFPIYLNYLKKSKKFRHYFQFKIGCKLKSFYDSNTIVHMPSKTFWPSNSNLEGENLFVYKRNNWLFLSFDHGIKIFKKLSIFYGLNFYLVANKTSPKYNISSDYKPDLFYFTFYHMGINYIIK